MTSEGVTWQIGMVSMNMTGRNHFCGHNRQCHLTYWKGISFMDVTWQTGVIWTWLTGTSSVEVTWQTGRISGDMTGTSSVDVTLQTGRISLGLTDRNPFWKLDMTSWNSLWHNFYRQPNRLWGSGTCFVAVARWPWSQSLKLDVSRLTGLQSFWLKSSWTCRFILQEEDQ